MQPIITSFLLAFAFLSAVPSTSAGAQETSPNSQFPVECATRDVQLVAQLEPYDMHSDIANEAFSRHQSWVEGALEAADAVIERLT